MSLTTLKEFAKQIGVTSEKLMQQLVAAGISNKELDGSLSDVEKEQLLTYLRGRGSTGRASERPKITISRKSTSSVRQSSRTGGSRTVHVEVRKRRILIYGLNARGRNL